jgi:cytochrome c heme-lyase
MQPDATCPVQGQSQEPSFATVGSGCPIDHTQLKAVTADKSIADSYYSQTKNDPTRPSSSLSTSRETSSIPRSGGDNWVYPSEAQFFAAMARKNHNPHAPDMKVIVPMHNAVNERTWNEVLKWEEGWGGEKCGGVKLVSFKGRSKDLSPKARWRSLLGCVASTRILSLESSHVEYAQNTVMHLLLIVMTGLLTVVVNVRDI